MNIQHDANLSAPSSGGDQATAVSRRARIRRRLWRVAAGLCLAAIGATAALPFLALPAARAEVGKTPLATTTSAPPPDLPEPTLPASLGIRALPLLSDAVEAKLSPDGVNVDPAALRSVGSEVASSLGLAWDSLLALSEPAFDDTSGYDTETGRLHPVEVARYASSMGAEGKLASNPQAVVDLSSLVALSGASYAGGIAEGLLTFGANPPTSCDKALNLAFIVTLSHTSVERRWFKSFSPESRTRLYTQDMLAACPDDPNALWFIADSQGAEEITSCGTQSTDPAVELPEEALTAARQLQRRFPTLAAGFAAEAEILMAKAEREGYVGIRPFLARQRWTEAEGLLAHALTLSSNPELVLARAKALTGMGRVEGAEVVRGLGAQATTTSGRRIVAAWVLAAAGDYVSARNAKGNVEPRSEHSTSPTRRLGLQQDLTLIGGAAGVAGNMGATATALKDPAQDQSQCGGGSSTFDGGFVPLSRNETFGPSGRGFLVPSTRFTSSLQWLNGDLVGAGENCNGSVEDPACHALGLVDTTSTEDAMAASQDLYRAAGQYPKAAEVVGSWLKAYPEDPKALELLAEVQLLQGNPIAASASLTSALESIGRHPNAGNCCDRWAKLKLGYTDHLLGKEDAALQQYRDIPDPIMESEVNLRVAYGLYYYRSLLEGVSLSEKGDWSAALSAFREAADFARKYDNVEDVNDFGIKARVAKGVAEQNGALAATRLGDFDTAVTLAEQALAFDPGNPLFIETLADAKRGQAVTAASTEFDVGGQPTSSPTTSSPTASGQPTSSPSTSSQGGKTTSQPATLEDLAASYRKALDVDPTMFSSWNNLGVLLAAGGHHDEATDAFRNAVKVRSDYATGWFNLGSELLLHGSWTQVLAAEGALGYAARYDSSLRSETPALTFDDEVYKSGLDLSRLLPPDWQLATSARRSTTPLTLALIVLLLGRVVTALSQDTLSGWIGEKTMALVARFPNGLLRWLHWPAWLGVLLSLTTFVLVGGTSGTREALVAGPCLVAIAVLPSVLRRAMGAVPNDGVAERTPALGVGVSAVLALAGIAWPPVPTMSASGDHSVVLRARRAVIVAVAGAVLVLVMSSWLGSVPVSRAVMSVGIASLGSLLVPLEPSDGAYLGKRFGLAATIALGGLTALQVLGLA